MKKTSFTVLMLSAASLMLSGCSGGDPIPNGDPRHSVTGKIRGFVAQPGVLAGADYSHYWVQHAMTGWDRSANASFPAKVGTLPRMRGCDFRKPAADEVVKNVHINWSNQRSSIFHKTRHKLGEVAKKYVKGYQARGERWLEGRTYSGDALNVIDVVVTEKSKPVYLTLTTSGNIVWNIHPAEGVKINHIALVGGRTLGLANVPAGTTIEMQQLSHISKCKRATPMRKPMPHWSFVQRVKAGASGHTPKMLKDNFGYYTRFARWYRQQFGISPSQDGVTMDRGSHALVGPVPPLEQRANYQPMEGASVLVSAVQHLHVINRSEWPVKHTALVNDYIEKTLKIPVASIMKDQNAW